MLLAFSEHRHEATVAELAQIAGCPMPTAYRYVALLMELELLRQGPTGTYHPSARVMPIACPSLPGPEPTSRSLAG